jgi:2,3-bisphosphoglycerate-dependent phosphoglycerate mutase
VGSLILIRHGQSEWNAQGRFTGWVDSPLSAAGRAEAVNAGRRLAASGSRVDKAFTSTLGRAIETGELILRVLGVGDLEQERAWELNERFYGALTGRLKAEVAEQFGAQQVRRWRRGYHIRPPGGESLADTAARTLPYFEGVILPAARRFEGVLVSAHGSSLRVIVQHLEELREDPVCRLEIPTGEPLVYHLTGSRARGTRPPGGRGRDAVAPGDRR